MKKSAVINTIKTAFKDVRLGDGIGLREGVGIDDYSSEQELLLIRKDDEKEHWQNIPFDDICEKYESAFSYLDAKGMRFLMPQYMMADILHEELVGRGIHMMFHPLWKLERIADGQFALFNPEQIQAVIDYIKYTIQIHTQDEIKTNIDCGIVFDSYKTSLHENFARSEVLQKWQQFLSLST